MTQYPAAKLQALLDVSDDLFESTEMRPTASNSRIDTLLSLDASNDHLQSILVSLIHTFGGGACTSADPLGHSDFCRGNQVSWQSGKFSNSNGPSLSRKARYRAKDLEQVKERSCEHATSTHSCYDFECEQANPVLKPGTKKNKQTKRANEANDVQLSLDACEFCLLERPSGRLVIL
mmetsp:Transcript_69336/g.137044  ORF Transcript_69336/g.137044 Transcript_69336/m.137044 type:complete len:177 (-) Transcript_69336:289-819(-)